MAMSDGNEGGFAAFAPCGALHFLESLGGFLMICG